MKPILEVRNIGKQYKIGGDKQSYLSMRDQVVNGVKGMFQKKEDKNTFWALKDVSFDVYPGESIGIIGRNGAGKSTLLKILSKITPPTEGYIKARGRVASLLEVGTGFHPELSGRENIYLNGSILGLTRSEINKKFDEIVEFSGVEFFLETALKHYSSGMQLRLAFAVAAHLEPEILVIDEVLAVGDAEFQKKCLGKMDEVSKSGRTILFVSHNMQAVGKLCKHSILLKKGVLIKKDITDNIISNYLSNTNLTNNFYKYPEFYEKYNEKITIEQILFKRSILTISLNSKTEFNKISIAFAIKNLHGTILFKSSLSPIWSNKTFSINGHKSIQIDLRNLNLINSNYDLAVFITIPNKEILVKIEKACSINIGNNLSPSYNGTKQLVSGTDGYITVDHKWKILNEN